VKGFIHVGRVELTGWVALEEGTYGTDTFEDEGVEGISLIMEEKGVEGHPEMFEFDLVLITG
jgi:hypothetical protein